MATNRVCTIAECGKPVVGRGLCKLHYQIEYRKGFTDPLPKKETRAFFDATLAAHADNCVIWPFARSSDGYAVMDYRRAHRTMCIAAHGDPPADRPFACHSCGNRACINPRHLRWGSAKDNADDSQAHGTVARGERNALAKLTEDDVRAIRTSPLGGRRLGAQYGVRPSLIWAIRKNLIWTHVS